MAIMEPIYQGLLQSDLDFAGHHALNCPDITGGSGSGLDANTVTATQIGLVGDGVTDNTTALQTWLNSVGAARVNATLLVPEGVYIFSGALQDSGRQNAQILFPSNAYTSRNYTITIKGYHPLSFIPWPQISMPTPSGAIFRSTLASGSGTQPSFFGGMGPHAGTPGGLGIDLSFISLRFEDMIFQTAPNPQISCLNLGRFSEVEFAGNVLVMAGPKLGENDVVQPTTTTSYGVIFPYASQGVLQRVAKLNISNFYTGALIGENTHLLSGCCWMCFYALEFQFGYQAALLEHFFDLWCRNGIRITTTGTIPFQVLQHFIETAPPALWYSRTYDFDDVNNYAIADVTWWADQAYVVAPLTAYVLHGGANVNTRRLGYAPGTVYVGTDLRLVSLAGGGKMQARNTGTGVWADVDQWTNP